METERDVKTYLLTLARKYGYECRKVRYEGRVGTPDWLLIGYGGELVWLELKRLGGVTSPSQDAEIEMLRSRGQRVLVLCGTDDVRELFETLRREHAS